MNKKQIKNLALSNGFKLKEQPSGEMDLNPYVYEFADALISKANERVKELDDIADTAFKYNHSSAECLRAWNKLQQLRKEQE